MVPIRAGEDRLVAFLQTGQVFLRPPSASRFRRSLRRLEGLGAVVDVAERERAYFWRPGVVPLGNHSTPRVSACSP